MDAITIQILRNKIASLVDEMHYHFYRSGYSTIIRESRDFSCVILDRTGRLIVAPPMFFHAPVYRHLVGRILELHGGHDEGHGITDEADLVHGQRVLVLAHGQDAERDGQLGADQRGHHAWVRGRLRDVDAADARVRVRRAQHLREQHAREDEVVGEHGLPRHLGVGVHLGQVLPDDAE